MRRTRRAAGSGTTAAPGRGKRATAVRLEPAVLHGAHDVEGDGADAARPGGRAGAGGRARCGSSRRSGSCPSAASGPCRASASRVPRVVVGPAIRALREETSAAPWRFDFARWSWSSRRCTHPGVSKGNADIRRRRPALRPTSAPCPSASTGVTRTASRPGAERESDQADLRAEPHEPGPSKSRSQDGQRADRQEPSENSVGDVHPAALRRQPLIRATERDEHQHPTPRANSMPMPIIMTNHTQREHER